MGGHEHFLVVDWDYFFPRPDEAKQGYRHLNPPGDVGERYTFYDWAHAETELHRGLVWGMRGAAFWVAGYELPTTQGWNSFPSRFRIRPGSNLYVADSNAHAALIHGTDERPFHSVWLYDAHHDCGYKAESVSVPLSKVSCENWMLHHQQMGSRLNWRWPGWLDPQLPTTHGLRLDASEDDGLTPPPIFTAVFICRSGAWVPPWCDLEFVDFVDVFASMMKTTPKDMEGCTPRAWESDVARATQVMREHLERTSQEGAG